MPKLLNPLSSDQCFYCSSQAYYISINSKRMRCKENVTQCPAIIEKQELSRQTNQSVSERHAHMVMMSKKGNDVLKEKSTMTLHGKRKKEIAFQLL